jgi:predicted nucleotidyltransferase
MTHAMLGAMDALPITAELEAKREALFALCRRFGVARLELFGSAARGADFAPARSDLDFLVTLTPAARDDLAGFAELQEALAALFGRRVDLLEREAIEASRNPIRRRRILAEARPLYAA